jgi:hypothetical protein
MSIRTTVTLDDDVRERLLAESRVRGISFKQAVNEILREGLFSKENRQARKPFKITPVPMGQAQPGVNFDCIGELLDFLEATSAGSKDCVGSILSPRASGSRNSKNNTAGIRRS